MERKKIKRFFNLGRILRTILHCILMATAWLIFFFIKRFFNLGRILRMILGGTLLATAWLIFFCIQIQNAPYYGLAILPAILVAIALFIIGAVIGALIPRKRKWVKAKRLTKIRL